MKKDILYYPHISFKDSALIKAASMLYDDIYRIVPDDVVPEDDKELAPLIEEGKVGKAINPARYSSEASNTFLEKIDEWDAAALCYSEEEQRHISRLHTDKTDEKVRRIFKEVGFKEKNNWMEIPTALASNYMLYLAREIAAKNDLSLMTQDWGAWTATNYFNLDGGVDEVVMLPNGKDDVGMPYALFSLIINEMTPLNIAEIPSKELLKFREKRKDEISNFRNCIFELNDILSTLDAPEIMRETILAKIKELKNAQDDYKKSADIILAGNLWKGFKLLGFPASATFASLFDMATPGTACVAIGGTIFGGMYHVNKTKAELKKLREESPVSALIEINKTFSNYTSARGGGDANFHAYNCMEEYVDD